MTYGFTPFQSLTTFIAKLSAIVNHQHNIDMPDVGEPHLTHTLKVRLVENFDYWLSYQSFVSKCFNLIG